MNEDPRLFNFHPIKSVSKRGKNIVEHLPSKEKDETWKIIYIIHYQGQEPKEFLTQIHVYYFEAEI